MSLKELKEKRGACHAGARSAWRNQEEHRRSSRGRADKRHDDIMAEFDKIEAMIAREQRLSAPRLALRLRAEEERAAKRPTGADTESARGQDEGAKPEYRAVFYKFLSGGASLDALDAEERGSARWRCR
jgi:HK97 family phage major capsid protein